MKSFAPFADFCISFIKLGARLIF
jgi:hypothetical protein